MYSEQTKCKGRIPIAWFGTYINTYVLFWSKLKILRRKIMQESKIEKRRKTFTTMNTHIHSEWALNIIYELEYSHMTSIRALHICIYHESDGYTWKANHQMWSVFYTNEANFFFHFTILPWRNKTINNNTESNRCTFFDFECLKYFYNKPIVIFVWVLFFQLNFLHFFCNT